MFQPGATGNDSSTDEGKAVTRLVIMHFLLHKRKEDEAKSLKGAGFI